MKISTFIISSILSFIMSGLIAPENRPPIKISKQQSAATINASLLSFFNLGIKRIYTDILWIQTLLESDLEHYKGNDGNSWMFQRFYTISLLDPKFIQNYWFGGQYLSVIKDDDLGAKNLFNRGLSIYPNDHTLLYYAGSHYLIELHDKENAIKYYEKIFNHPRTPNYIKALITRIKADIGFLDESYQLVEQLYNEAPKNSSLKEAYHKRLYAIRAEIDLKCLNNKESNCRYYDLLGKPYIQKNGIYYSQKKWEKYRTYSKNKNERDRLPTGKN